MTDPASAATPDPVLDPAPDPNTDLVDDSGPDPAAGPGPMLEPDDPVADLLDVLDLAEVGLRHIEVSGEGESGRTGTSDAVLFRGRSQPQAHGRVFGGQVLAQCVIAAGRTVIDLDGPPRHIHSLHGYFLRPGDPDRDIEFVVERMRDGGSFSARRVHAVQSGSILLSMNTSFQEEAAGLDHQEAMPDVPDPESLRSVEDVIAELADIDDPRVAMFAKRRAIDLRHVDGQIWGAPSPSRNPSTRVWLRAAGPLPDDALLHAAVLTYASDYSLLEPILRRHGVSWSDPRLRPASLDHAMWFHRPARIDEWTLYTQSSPSAQGGRGLGLGRMFARDGTLVTTVAQEGMVRLKE